MTEMRNTFLWKYAHNSIIDTTNPKNDLEGHFCFEQIDDWLETEGSQIDHNDEGNDSEPDCQR